MSRLLLLFSIVVFGTGCAWTLSPKRQARINDCLSRCDSMQAEPGPNRGLHDPQDGTRDARSDCERRCHALGE
jgi:hypothetical protein